MSDKPKVSYRCGECKWHYKRCAISGKIVYKLDFKCKNFKIKDIL